MIEVANLADLDLSDFVDSVHRAAARVHELRTSLSADQDEIAATVEAAARLQEDVLDHLATDVVPGLLPAEDDSRVVVDIRDGAAVADLYELHRDMTTRIEELKVILDRIGGLSVAVREIGNGAPPVPSVRRDPPEDWGTAEALGELYA